MKNKELNIYIIEDDRFYGNLVKQVLTENGHNNIKLYQSGEECLKNLHNSPDVIILDHNLGHMNGIDVLKKIVSYNPDIKVIYLSSQEKATIASESLLFGAAEYLEKSSDTFNRLLQVMDKIILKNNLSSNHIN